MMAGREKLTPLLSREKTCARDEHSAVLRHAPWRSRRFKARGIFAQKVPAVAIPAQIHLSAMFTGFDASEALSGSVTGAPFETEAEGPEPDNAP
jgi:hypothetical protein